LIGMVAYLFKVALSLPLGLFLMAGTGWILARRKRRLGFGLIWAAGILLWLTSTPWVSSAILYGLQHSDSLDMTALPKGPSAVVVLGADLTPYSPEMRGPDIGPLTLVRLRYGAQLARAAELPILVSGGILVPKIPPLANLMAKVLTTEYGFEKVWRDPASRTTFENAEMSTVKLQRFGVEHIFLVTHAWHMPRALAAFERCGIEVTPAPTAYQLWPTRTWRGFVPSARALRSSSFGIHEWCGRVYYALRS
jgi:uncharacterized SAM-binding protein YcdF (DUF218 family)